MAGISSTELRRIYDDWDREHQEEGIRELPTIMMGDGTYYIDARLQEIRNVEDPFDTLSFNQIDMLNGYAQVIERYAEQDEEEQEEREGQEEEREEEEQGRSEYWGIHI